MVVYYRLSGINAVVALILNLVLLLAALAYFGAVLTLPGIAGVILTIGMGVDSNVLIFERIREELRAAKAPVSAVDIGFKRAFLTIIDTHVTTIRPHFCFCSERVRSAVSRSAWPSGCSRIYLRRSTCRASSLTGTWPRCPARPN